MLSKHGKSTPHKTFVFDIFTRTFNISSKFSTVFKIDKNLLDFCMKDITIQISE